MLRHSLQDIAVIENWGLPESLRAFRHIYGFSQRRLAEILEISRPTYSYYESGKTEPSVAMLRKLALIYSVPMDVFFEFEYVKKCSARLIDDHRCNPFEHSCRGNTEEIHFGDLDVNEKDLLTHLRLLPKGSVEKASKRILLMKTHD